MIGPVCLIIHVLGASAMSDAHGTAPEQGASQEPAPERPRLKLKPRDPAAAAKAEAERQASLSKVRVDMRDVDVLQDGGAGIAGPLLLSGTVDGESALEFASRFSWGVAVPFDGAVIWGVCGAGLQAGDARTSRTWLAGGCGEASPVVARRARTLPVCEKKCSATTGVADAAIFNRAPHTSRTHWAFMH